MQMNATHHNANTEAVVERLDLVLERAELVQTLGRLDDRIHRLRQSNAPDHDIQLLERTASSLQRRLQEVKRRGQLE